MILNVALGDENILYDVTKIKEVASFVGNANNSTPNKNIQPLYSTSVSQNDNGVNPIIQDNSKTNSQIKEKS